MKKRLLYLAAAGIVAGGLLCVDAFASKKDALEGAVMGQNIHGTGDLIVDAKEVFLDSDSEIIWLGKFTLFGASSEAALKIEWYAPSGEIFKTAKFKPYYWNTTFAWSKLDIQGEDNAALSHKGQWRVKVYFDDELINEKKFWMGYPTYE